MVDTSSPSSSFSIYYSHISAICYAFHIALLVLVYLVRRVVFLFHRKSKVLDQFLQQVFHCRLSKDALGISVHQFAIRAKVESAISIYSNEFKLTVSSRRR
jgi:hypothetical protein